MTKINRITRKSFIGVACCMIIALFIAIINNNKTVMATEIELSESINNNEGLNKDRPPFFFELPTDQWVTIQSIDGKYLKFNPTSADETSGYLDFDNDFSGEANQLFQIYSESTLWTNLTAKKLIYKDNNDEISFDWGFPKENYELTFEHHASGIFSIVNKHFNVALTQKDGKVVWAPYTKDFSQQFLIRPAHSIIIYDQPITIQNSKQQYLKFTPTSSDKRYGDLTFENEFSGNSDQIFEVRHDNPYNTLWTNLTNRKLTYIDYGNPNIYFSSEGTTNRAKISFYRFTDGRTAIVNGYYMVGLTEVNGKLVWEKYYGEENQKFHIKPVNNSN